MKNSQSWQHTVRTGVIIILPTVAGFCLDWLFNVFTWTFAGAAFTVFELFERMVERTTAGAIQYCFPDKFAGYQDIEEMDSNDPGH